MVPSVPLDEAEEFGASHSMTPSPPAFLGTSQDAWTCCPELSKAVGLQVAPGDVWTFRMGGPAWRISSISVRTIVVEPVIVDTAVVPPDTTVTVLTTVVVSAAPQAASTALEAKPAIAALRHLDVIAEDRFPVRFAGLMISRPRGNLGPLARS
jgi:hypothetical protein